MHDPSLTCTLELLPKRIVDGGRAEVPSGDAAAVGLLLGLRVGATVTVGASHAYVGARVDNLIGVGVDVGVGLAEREGAAVGNGVGLAGDGS